MGRFVAVGFPNFGHINVRAHLFFKGKAPVTSGLPYFWYNTPNTRFLTIADFRLFCKKKNIQVLKRFYLGKNRRVYVWPNMFAQNAVFLLSK